MIGFSPAERADVDRQFKTIARALHELDPELPKRLRTALTRAESGASDVTLARVLVAGEILRGIAAEARSPLTQRNFAMPGELAEALAEAERLGRVIGPHALSRSGGLLSRLRPRRRFAQAGKEALMRCRAIGAAQQRRLAASQPGRELRPG